MPLFRLEPFTGFLSLYSKSVMLLPQSRLPSTQADTPISLSVLFRFFSAPWFLKTEPKKSLSRMLFHHPVPTLASSCTFSELSPLPLICHLLLKHPVFPLLLTLSTLNIWYCLSHETIRPSKLRLFLSSSWLTLKHHVWHTESTHILPLKRNEPVSDFYLLNSHHSSPSSGPKQNNFSCFC